jgi:hypothetical protein
MGSEYSKRSHNLAIEISSFRSTKLRSLLRVVMGKIHALFADALQPPTPDSLLPARARLREAITARVEAHREGQTAAEPIHRLDAVGSESERLTAELAQLRAADEAELGRWLASGSGPRPQPSAATIITEQRLVELAPDLRAATTALPGARAVHQAVMERANAAAIEHGLALSAVALEAAEPGAGELTTALNGALALEARLLSLREELRAHPDNGRGAAADKIDALIRTAKASAGVPRNSEAGRRLLEALSAARGGGADSWSISPAVSCCLMTER